MNTLLAFFSELQRRHVYKVGVMYGVGGWLLVQIATQVLPVFDVPSLAQRIIVIIIVAGFPVAVVLAWIFDVTPTGVVRTDDEPAPLPKRPSLPIPDQNTTPRPPREPRPHPRAVVAEDEDTLRGEICETLAALWPELEICADVGDGISALHALESEAPDILFLDIRMPGLTGLEVAQHASRRAHVVFITAYDEHAVAAFEQGALDYVLKPITPARLAQTVTRLKQRIGGAPADLDGIVERLRQRDSERADNDHPLQWISVLEGSDLRLITVGDVCYIKVNESSEGRASIIVTADLEHQVSKSVQKLGEQLDPKTFWHIDRHTIVNVNAIHSVHRDFRGRLELRLKQRSETLPVSSAYAALFKNL